MNTVRVGTRASALALAQTREVVRALKRRHPKQRFSIVKIKTTGDEYRGVHLFKKNHVGVFTKKIERRLLDGKVDIAVHSMKDLPTTLARGLTVAAVLRRADVADALISRERHTLRSLPAGSRIGTGSPRRKRQLALLRPDIEIVDLRGNLDTRVSKVLRERVLDGVIVARAGLKRLKRFRRYLRRIDPKIFLPAVGQGALAIEARQKDERAKKIARALNHPESERLVAAEREFLKRLRGGCRVPAGILSRKIGGRIRLRAAVYSVRSDGFVEGVVERPWAQAAEAARTLAEDLLCRGARRFLRQARAS